LREWVRAKRDVGPAAPRLFLKETAPHDGTSLARQSHRRIALALFDPSQNAQQRALFKTAKPPVMDETSGFANVPHTRRCGIVGLSKPAPRPINRANEVATSLALAT
jgi:hypothetical protein